MWFGVGHRLPAIVENHAVLDLGSAFAEEAEELSPKRVRAEDANGLDVANSEIDQVGDDVACAAKAVSLATDAADGQTGLNGELSVFGIEDPVGVEAEVAEDASAKPREGRDGAFEPGRLSQDSRHRQVIGEQPVIARSDRDGGSPPPVPPRRLS